jgi:NAD+ synthase
MLPATPEKVRRARAGRWREGADLVVFPELFIAGYPPEDLVLKPAFQSACRAAIEALARETADGGPAMLIGTSLGRGRQALQCLRLLDGGASPRMRFKVNLPNYGVFDEKRVFARAPAAGPGDHFRGVRVGVPICEDIWLEESAIRNVVECLAETGAEILVVPNGSPYARDKNDVRLSIAVARVTESGLPLIYLNQVGGQDELVFDGASFALNADLLAGGAIAGFRGNRHHHAALVRTAGGRLALQRAGRAAAHRRRQGRLRRLRAGPARLCRKNGFPGVRARLLGRHRFGAVRGDGGRCAGRRARPRRDAAVSLHRAGIARRRRRLAKALGIRYEVLPIAQAVNGFEAILSGTFRRPAARYHRRESAGAHARHAPDGDFQQVRRDGGHHRQQVGNVGRLRHALWRHERRLQSDQGYLQDRSVRLSRLRNRWKPDGALGPSGEVIPVNIITRPPTAELRENQTDQDSLPPYDGARCDPGAAGRARGAAGSIVAAGFDREVVTRIDRLLNIAEYKRRQAAPGVKVTRRISAATAAIPSPTASAIPGRRCRQVAALRRELLHLSVIARPKG